MVPPDSLTSFAVCCTLSLRSTATSFAPSFANSSEAARPMPLPAPVMMTDFAFEAAHMFLPVAGFFSACRHAEFEVAERRSDLRHRSVSRTAA
jgi:hypothetical protein